MKALKGDRVMCQGNGKGMEGLCEERNRVRVMGGCWEGDGRVM